MQQPDWARLRQAFLNEGKALLTIQPGNRPWQLPFAAALASGGPLIVGATTGQLAAGAIGAVAGLSFLYLPATGLHHRVPLIMASTFAMICSYALGLHVAGAPVYSILLIAAIAMAAMLFCKSYNLVPPGPLFMIMVAAIGAFSPAHPAGQAANLGTFTLGCIWACALAIAYSAYILRHRPPLPFTPPSDADLRAGVSDAIVTGLFVGVSLAVAAALEFDKAYWVPVSCAAVMQGLTLRASWSRNVHRIIGTVGGLAITWLLLRFTSNAWVVAAAVTILTFLIETAVVRHYAFAALFITPLTIILAESSGFDGQSVSALMTARLTDTIVGALIGLVGAVCLHSPRVRQAVQAIVFRRA